MSATTVPVTFIAADQNGDPVAGATITAALDVTEIDDGFIVPEKVEVVANELGEVVLNLWPNALGVNSSRYRIQARNPDTGRRFLDVLVSVPNSPCNLHQILVQEPFPAIDAAQQALTAAQVALAPVTAQASIATTKAAEALASANASESSRVAAGTSATAAAGSATTATAQATLATERATAAAGSATAATSAATSAQTSATAAAGSQSAAATSATTATTQAAAAVTSANASEASRVASGVSATAAATSAASAQGSANTSAAAAVSAATSATNAAGSAATAVTQASAAGSSASTAATLASAANVSALSASSSASAASTSAATATTKAAEAVAARDASNASAGAASTSASNAAADRALAVQSATTATTGAAIATTKANEITASAATANAKAGEAAGSAAQALAIYGTAAAQQTAIATAAAQASLAAGYALSAGSVAQQDLSGVTAQALHRSPNAVTAMFVYDTSKDSDGGAWTERCEGTSWYNEPVMGKWLGARGSELEARNENAALGPELVTNGDFSVSATGWEIQSPLSVSVTGGVAIVTGGTAAFESFYQIVPVVVGKTYRVSATHTSLYFDVSTGLNSVYLVRSMGASAVFTATTTSAFLRIRVGANQTVTADNISIREVTVLTTQSGDYYQSTVDGKFYRLNKNLLRHTGNFVAGVWTSLGATGTAGTTRLVENSANSAHCTYQSYGVANGSLCSFSVELKAGERNIAWVGFGGGLPKHIKVNLTTGAVLNTPTVSYSVVATDSGFWRVSVLGVVQSTSSGPVIHLCDAAGNDTYQGDGVSGIDVRNSQWEYGSTATTYEAKTTDGSITETFRGNKRRFPKLAGIVAEAGSVTLYDLAEPGRPMWMRFVSGVNTTFALGWANSGSTVGSLAALSGKLFVGSTSGNNVQADFARDDMRLAYSGSSAHFLRNRSISARHNIGGLFVTGGDGYPIANFGVNAVAMTVLPDAPTDPVTGLKVPTIAVATNGGVSVIRHDGTVRNLSIAANTNRDVVFKGDRLYVSGVPGTNLGIFSTNGINSTSITAANYFSWFGLPQFSMTGVNEAPDIVFAPQKNLLFSRPGDGGVAMLVEHYSQSARSIAVRLTSTFNTGYKSGDIRRAYLSDVDVGSVSGPELVVNGGFDTDASGWSTLNGATLAAVDGKLRLTSQAANYGAAQTGVVTVVGKTYTLTLDISGTFSTSVQVGGATVLASAIRSGAFRVSFVAAATTTGITLLVNSGVGNSIEFDNISVREAIPDRSYKAQGANIIGTLTKSPVASAAQLVAYSGFSNANYLREPYSADLDFGVGEWSAGAWVNVPVVLTDANFPAVSVPMTMNTAEWTKGVGWSTPGAFGFSSDGSQAAASDLSWNSANRVPSNPAAVRRWTITVTAVNGILVVYPSNGSPIAITTPGTYYGYGDVLSNWGTAILRMNAAGQTCSGTLVIDDLLPAQIADRGFSSGPSVKVGCTRFGRLFATAFDGTTTRTVTTPAQHNTATLLKAEADYTTDGTLSISVNGVEVAATRGAPLLTLNNSNAVLTIGNSFALDAPFPGSIALLKLGATVPTAEQSVWMYEQEKQMFREGAQVTLPDAGAVVDLAYDDLTDKWIAVSAANESEWSGLVRTSVTPVPAGSYTRVSAASGVQLLARTTTSPGVDISAPAQNLREELIKRGEAAARLNAQLATFDYVGGFTATTASGSTAITSVASLTYPVSPVGARVTGAGIPADTFVAALVGTTAYLTKAATASASAVQISFTDFILPPGMEARSVLSGGANRVEGATKDFTRLFDGFKETIRFGTAPGFAAAIQIQAARSAA